MDFSVQEILKLVKEGKITLEEGETRLRLFPIQALKNFARVDLARHVRRGIPEIIFAENKTPEEVAQLARHLAWNAGAAIVSRINLKHARKLNLLKPKFSVRIKLTARMAVVRRRSFKPKKLGGKVGIVTAGTSDISVAEEAKIVATELGCEVYTAYDVGVAGIHRLFEPLKQMLERGVDALVVVAGMEGALPSIIASLVDVPTIGVPASSGYGYGGGGEGALMSMLQSCALGLAVVNIDNGVGAGAFAALIANRTAKAKEK